MKKNNRARILLPLLILAAACGPAKIEVFEEIQPSETAFVIPLEGASKSGQGKFDSVDFLEAKKVPAKRISLPLRKKSTGRAWFSYEYIPTVRVITVDRASVTREWTNDLDRGSSSRPEGLTMESKDSIGFSIGSTITARIDEADAATFLYHYGGKSLSDVIDTNVRSVCQGSLSREFGALDLDNCREEKGSIFKTVNGEIVAFFKDKGITIEYFGLSEGLSYENPEIQRAIDQKFKALEDIKTARNEKLAQDERNAQTVAVAKAQADAEIERARSDQTAQQVRNDTLVAKKTAEAQAAGEIFAASEAFQFEMEWKLRELDAQARVEAAKNLPASILPSGSPLLMGLDTPKAKDSE